MIFFQTSALKKPRSKKPGPAFTLVEVLLALAIFSMLIAALYSTWILVMRATIVGKGTAAQLQRERVAISTIENSLTCIQSHQASIDYYLFDIQNGDQPILSFAAYLPPTFPRSGEFTGITSDGSGYMDYNLRRVTFSLQPGDGNSRDLVLRQNPILMDMSPDEQNNPLILAKNVSAFLIECWDTNSMTWETSWDATNMIPPLVRVTLGFNSPNSGGAQVITREISFPSGTMPSMVQSPNYNGGGGGFNNFQFGNGQGNNQGNQGNQGNQNNNPSSPLGRPGSLPNVYPNGGM